MLVSPFSMLTKPPLKKCTFVIDVSIVPRLSYKTRDSSHWILAKVSVISAASMSRLIYTHDLFDLMSPKLGTSHTSSPRAFLAL
jgi:hypothetical protein